MEPTVTVVTHTQSCLNHMSLAVDTHSECAQNRCFCLLHLRFVEMQKAVYARSIPPDAVACRPDWINVSPRRSSHTAEWYAAAMLKRPQECHYSFCYKPYMGTMSVTTSTAVANSQMVDSTLLLRASRKLVSEETSCLSPPRHCCFSKLVTTIAWLSFLC